MFEDSRREEFESIFFFLDLERYIPGGHTYNSLATQTIWVSYLSICIKKDEEVEKLKSQSMLL